MEIIHLKPGREKSVLNHHPWIFENSIRSVTGEPQPGESVEIRSVKDGFLGVGAYSPRSNIRVRVWTWDPSEKVNADFFRERIERCREIRNGLSHWMDANAYRLIYAEADGLPGLIVDRYDDSLVAQSLSAGIEYWREVIFDILAEDPSIQRIYERSDVDVNPS